MAIVPWCRLVRQVTSYVMVLPVSRPDTDFTLETDA